MKLPNPSDLHARYAARLHQNQHGSDLPWTKCRVPSCLLAQEVAEHISRVTDERDKAMWVAKNLSAAQSGAEWMREKAARKVMQMGFQPDPEDVARAIRELSAEGDEDESGNRAAAAPGDG
jgi:hypothetical protein